jgi:hypothetical protein
VGHVGTRYAEHVPYDELTVGMSSVCEPRTGQTTYMSTVFVALGLRGRMPSAGLCITYALGNSAVSVIESHICTTHVHSVAHCLLVGTMRDQLPVPFNKRYG